MFSILSMFSVFSQLTPCSLSQSNNTTVKLIIHVSDYSSKIISFGFRLPAVQPCNWIGFRISLSREDKIFRDVIENYFACSHLARRDQDIIWSRQKRDYILLRILMFWDEIDTLENYFSWSCEKKYCRLSREFTGAIILADLCVDVDVGFI